MSEELDWLALNLSEWPNADKIDALFKTGRVKEWSYRPADNQLWLNGFSEHDWMTRRADLQKKPSWEGAPEWAGWVAMDGDGYWYWYETEPELIEKFNVFRTRYEGREKCSGGRSTILDDWRDTLERRPEREVTAKEDVALTAALMSSSKPVELGKAAEWSGLQDGLPPVGAEIGTLSGGPVLIKGYFGSQVWYQTQQGEDVVKLIENAQFRPMRTEEDKAVEEMCRVFDGKWPATRAVMIEAACKDLYRAGYRKTEQSK